MKNRLKQRSKLGYEILFLALFLNTGVVLAQECGSTLRDTTPSRNFVTHDDGTVTDTSTDLMWKVCREGTDATCNDDDFSSNDVYTWKEALEVAANSDFAGHTDWRLPNIKELNSIVERKCKYPAINLSIFPNTGRHYFWTSSPDTYYYFGYHYAKVVGFNKGFDDYVYRTNSYRVRLVRSVAE